MVKKLQKIKAPKKTSQPLADSVKDSAQQVWQAGLGAFNRAQAEGSKAFESLVKEGVTLQRKTQSAAEEKVSEASHKMSAIASDISAKATGQWDKLEGIFEDRVAKALHKLGVPSAKEIDALMARIEALNKSVQKLSEKAASGKAGAKTTAKPAAKPAAKSAAKKVAAAVKKPATRAAAKPPAKRTPARKTARSTARTAPSI
jgi:poly(hydroxyalkanoate) granule-associated protein